MAKTYTCCHAPNTDIAIHIYDRDNQLLTDPMALMSRATGLRFSKVVSSGGVGGYNKCSFNLPIPLAQKVLLRGGQQVEVRCGRSTAWAGRISDMVRTTKGGGDLQITALGLSSHLNQTRISESAASGETAADVLQRCMQNCALISPDFEHWEDTGYDIGGISWTRKTVREIAEKCLSMGDSSNREIMLNIWRRGVLPVSGAVSTSKVAASADDAHDRTDDGDNSNNMAVVRIGYDAANVATYCGGLIFPAPGFGRYTKILSCTVHMYSRGEIGADEPMIVRLYFEKNSAPSDFTVSWPSDRTTTDEYVTWSQVWPADGNWVETGDLTVPLQEVVNMAGFNSSSELCLIIQGTDQAPNDTRKQFESKDDGSGHEAYIDITYGIPEYMKFVFESELISRIEATPANVDYLIYPGDVSSGITINETLGELYNQVAATYGESVTSYSTDSSSQDLYDVRYNDPTQLDAGDDATQGQAEQLRDTYLAEHKDPKWRASNLSVRRLRNRYGQLVNLALVEPRCIVDLRVMPKMIADDNGRPLFISATEYNHDAGTLTLSPDYSVDLLAMLIVRMKKQLES